jgi:hypothetical protein
MQTPREISENRAMHGIAVALLTEDHEHLSELQDRVEATRLARVVFTNVGFPTGPTDSILRQIQDLSAEVVVIDISAGNPQAAIKAIELIQANTLQLAIFANGTLQQPTTIVASMRAGAGEYLDDSAGTEALLEALTRFSSNRTRTRGGVGKARIFTFLSAKGGSGATTAAVNTAVALQQAHGSVVLVDFAPVGHAQLHLNVRPSFGVPDALQNLHRLDVSLLDGLMTTPARSSLIRPCPRRRNWPACSTCWSITIATWSSMHPAALMRRLACSPTFRTRCSWWLKPTWSRCGAPAASMPSSKKAQAATGCVWF